MTITMPDNAPVALVPTGHRITLPTGLVLGSRDTAGVLWVVTSVQGWEGADSSGSVTQRPRQHGGWATPASYGPRTMVIQGRMVAPTTAGARAGIDRLLASVPLDVPEPVTVTEGGLQRYVLARQADKITTSWRSPEMLEYSIQLSAPDPRRLAVTAVTRSTGLPSVTGGLTLPTRVPFSIGATVATGSITLTNAGTTTGRLRLRVDGPVQGPVITHAESGRVLAMAPSYALQAGEWLEFDTDARTVLANGQASRAGSLAARQWPALQPGVNTFHFSAPTHSDSALLTVEGTSAWI